MFLVFKEFGGGVWNRTTDLRIMSTWLNIPDTWFKLAAI